ncbi:MAG TPA: MgtC/SapB family protein [Gemmatimonadales bacterium]|nr:MgtC/SapB family protein [Gemmatimonadales bacterium]
MPPKAADEGNVGNDMVDIVGSTEEIFARLAVAMIAGFVLGINRELRGKPAGVRTHGLVALGACLVTIVTMEIAHFGGRFNPDAVSRVIQGVITGIGFIGGGVILKLPEARAVQGLTTAASVWVTACVAVAFGAGMWRTALLGLGLTLMALLFGGPIEALASRVLKGDPRPSGWNDD